jgi:hypothetical protein
LSEKICPSVMEETCRGTWLGVGNAVPNSNSERQALMASNVATELEGLTDDVFQSWETENLRII